MQKISNVKVPINATDKDILLKVCKTARIEASKIKYFKIVKKSLDARNKVNIFYNVSAEVSLETFSVPKKEYSRVKDKGRILVVGAGPAGLFCALDLLRYGLDVTLIERGKSVDERSKSVSEFINNRILDEESNIQFGEGGAGTFSDGKLNTQVGGELIKSVLDEFVNFGAPSEIAYLSKPHIGSDNLPKVVKNIRNEIISLGGKVLFDTKLTDMTIKDGKIEKVVFNDKIEETFDDVVLAIGHSSRDTYNLVYAKNIFIEPKDFAIGYRIEHLAKDINFSQYGEKYASKDYMPTAEYKLTSSYNGRGVFTFCMCPGGYVMPSTSLKNKVVVNGMSNFKRNGVNSNSAIIVQVKKEDYKKGALGGVEFQNALEEKAFILGGEDYSAPCQLVGDYLSSRESKTFNLVKPSYAIGTKMANLSNFLPNGLDNAIKFAIVDMGKRLKGFDSGDAVLTAVESRTSSPLRITRTENYNGVNCKNLYPCGEGCGYSGGITSSAIDGKKVALAIAKKYGA